MARQASVTQDGHGRNLRQESMIAERQINASAHVDIIAIADKSTVHQCKARLGHKGHLKRQPGPSPNEIISDMTAARKSSLRVRALGFLGPAPTYP